MIMREAQDGYHGPPLYAARFGILVLHVGICLGFVSWDMEFPTQVGDDCVKGRWEIRSHPRGLTGTSA